MARNDRTVRLEVVKRALAESRRGVLLKSLAEKHGWNLRTLHRDIEALQAAHFPIAREGQHGNQASSRGPSGPRVD